MGQLPVLTASRSAALAKDMPHLEAYLIGRPFFEDARNQCHCTRRFSHVAHFKDCAGSYANDEQRATWTLVVKDGKLIRHRFLSLFQVTKRDGS